MPSLHRHFGNVLSKALLLGAVSLPLCRADAVPVQAAEAVPPHACALPLSFAAPKVGLLLLNGVSYRYVRGGRLASVYRQGGYSVKELVRQGNGVSGLNGGFFDATFRMAGPTLCSADGRFTPLAAEDAEPCTGRPLVLLGANRMAIVPFLPSMGDSLASLRRLLPDARDAFLGGGWLVHAGVPLSRLAVHEQCIANALERRPRAVMGFDAKGMPLLCATEANVDSVEMAAAMVRLGAREAVLLDSGFSTALVWHGRLLVDVRASRRPLRPVPHALVVQDVPGAAPHKAKKVFVAARFAR